MTRYAGLVTRTIAFAVDALIIDVVALAIAAVVALALSILAIPKSSNTVIIAVGGVAFFLWSVGYFVTFWSTTGQTPGDRLMELRVACAHGDGPLRPARAAIRFAGLVLAALPLFAGFVPILFTERRRGLQDWLAGSVVRQVRAGDSPASDDAALTALPLRSTAT